MKISLLAIVLMCGVSWAAEPTVITAKELDGLKSGFRDAKVSTWYYMGEKQNFQYFYHSDQGDDSIYKVSSTDLRVQPNKPYRSTFWFKMGDDSLWTSMNWDAKNLTEKNGAKLPAEIVCLEKGPQPRCTLTIFP